MNSPTHTPPIVPVLEEAQSLVGPDPHEAFDRECLERPQSLADASHPACHLTRTVDVVGLHLLGELLLSTQYSGQFTGTTLHVKWSKGQFLYSPVSSRLDGSERYFN